MVVGIDIVPLNPDRPYAADRVQRLSASEDEALVTGRHEFMDKPGLPAISTPH